MQSVIEEEKVKSDVIVSDFRDSNRDIADVEPLCTEVGFSSKPISVQRLGKSPIGKSTEQPVRPRLLKITFKTPFDARTFQAKVEEAKKSETLSQSTLRCRPGRTKEEQTKFTKLKSEIYKLNQSADTSVESFSLRQDI